MALLGTNVTWERALALDPTYPLDQLQSPGFYDVVTPTNSPDNTKNYYVFVHAPSARVRPAGIYQTVVRQDNGASYTRIYGPSGWTDWTEVGAGGGGGGGFTPQFFFAQYLETNVQPTTQAQGIIDSFVEIAYDDFVVGDAPYGTGRLPITAPGLYQSQVWFDGPAGTTKAYLVVFVNGTPAEYYLIGSVTDPTDPDVPSTTQLSHIPQAVLNLGTVEFGFSFVTDSPTPVNFAGYVSVVKLRPASAAGAPAP